MPINKLKPKYKAVKKSRGRRIRKTKRRTRKRSKKRSKRRSKSMLFSMRGGGICPLCRAGKGLAISEPWAPNKEGAIFADREANDPVGPITKQRAFGECPVCFEVKNPDDMVMLPCKHIFCRVCLAKVGFYDPDDPIRRLAPGSDYFIHLQPEAGRGDRLTYEVNKMSTLESLLDIFENYLNSNPEGVDLFGEPQWELRDESGLKVQVFWNKPDITISSRLQSGTTVRATDLNTDNDTEETGI